MKISKRFDLVDLRLFLLVVEAASITHGAARAGTALVSASERIRLMEDSLGGASLLERNRRGVRATPAGSILGATSTAATAIRRSQARARRPIRPPSRRAEATTPRQEIVPPLPGI
jgi:DNA-binding transcriptional LysR family regulator